MVRPRFLRASVFLFLLAALLGPAPGVTAAPFALDRSLALHPFLQVGASREPNKLVRVIVQKKSASFSSSAIAKSAGGLVREEFRSFDSFITEIPQGKAPALARHVGVRYVSFNAPVRQVGGIEAKDLTNLETTHQQALGVEKVWSASTYEATGNGVNVAVIDTGLNDQHADLGAEKCFIVNTNNSNCSDMHGHGTHVAGIITGFESNERRYLGIAPFAGVISVKVADRNGAVSEADLLRGLQWVADNQAALKIRVVNLSLSMAMRSSYTASPVSAAVEALWFKGVVVVASAGNRGAAADAAWYAPGNDPYIITVGAIDHNGTVGTADDRLADFSSRGRTQDGFAKPELVAPGRKIVAPLAGRNSTLARQFPDRIVYGDDNNGNRDYVRLSGTSMSAPMVTGIVALLLEKYPTLTPDQVKWLLMQTANGYAAQPDAAGVVDVVEAMARAQQGKVGSANQGLTPAKSAIPTSGFGGPTAAYWDAAYWDAAYWDAAYWDAAYWDNSTVQSFDGD
jgi:serine protease AprX